MPQGPGLDGAGFESRSAWPSHLTLLQFLIDIFLKHASPVPSLVKHSTTQCNLFFCWLKVTLLNIFVKPLSVVSVWALKKDLAATWAIIDLAQTTLLFFTFPEILLGIIKLYEVMEFYSTINSSVCSVLRVVVFSDPLLWPSLFSVITSLSQVPVHLFPWPPRFQTSIFPLSVWNLGWNWWKVVQGNQGLCLKWNPIWSVPKKEWNAWALRQRFRWDFPDSFLVDSSQQDCVMGRDGGISTVLLA